MVEINQGLLLYRVPKGILYSIFCYNFEAARKIQQLGVKVIGIPATIENDMVYTDYSIGFDTTVNTILDCIHKIKDTSLSHDKTTIVEVIGRHCGDLALFSALAGGGEIISTPGKETGFKYNLFYISNENP